MGERMKTVRYYVAAFLLPMSLLLIAGIAGGQYPFGEKTILTWDLDYEYIGMFSWLVRVLKGQSMDSLWYSFSATWGSNTVGILGYYLLSPFNVILMLFSTETMPIGIMLVTVVKISCCGVTMCFYLKNRFHVLSYGTVLFSTMYALMGYNIAYMSNIMWIDGVFLLPVFLICIYWFIEGHEKRLISYIVAIMIISEFYIAYMVIIFGGLYFILEWSLKREKWRWKAFFRMFVRFIGAVLLGVGMSSVILLPVVYDITQLGRGGENGILDTIANLFCFDKKILMLPMKSLIGSYDEQQLGSGLPNIYISIFGIWYSFLYFLDQRNDIKEKISYTVLLIVMFISFSSIGINQIWHGFTYTAGSNYRYSFCVSFLMVMLGYKQYLLIKRSKRMAQISEIGMAGLIVSVIWCLGVAWCQFTMQIYTFSSIKKWIISAVILLLVIGLTVCFHIFENKLYVIAVTVVLGTELVLNMLWSLAGFEYTDYSDYRSYVNELETAYQELQTENGGEFFRVEHQLNNHLNDAMLIGYPSITHYSSVIPGEVMEYAKAHNANAQGFFKGVAFRSENMSAEQAGQMAIKYLLSYELPGDMHGWKIIKKDSFYVLENERFRPLCYLEQGTGKIVIDINKSNDIKIAVSNEQGNAILRTSIPYEKGWSIKVDGREKKPIGDDLMMAVDIEKGTHEIQLKYVQPFLRFGSVVSIISLILTEVWNWRRNGKEKISVPG